jgi:hypothetical protein
MTRTTRRALVGVYGALLKAGWGEPTGRGAEPATVAELELKKVMRAIERLQRLRRLQAPTTPPDE